LSKNKERSIKRREKSKRREKRSIKRREKNKKKRGIKTYYIYKHISL
jgi:hypothetical protein